MTEENLPQETPIVESPEAPSVAPEVTPEDVVVAVPLPQNSAPTIPQLSIALALLVGVLGSPYALSLWHSFEGAPEAAQESRDAAVPEERASADDPFADVTLEARAAYVWDVAAQKPLYAKHADERLPLASLTKLMTGLVAYETHASDDTIAITLDAIAQDGEDGFSDGDLWRTQDLLDFTMVSSSNDGAYALAAAVGESGIDGEETFVSRMNNRADELGLKETYYTNPTGLDMSESVSGGYGSARDMAFLMEYIVTRAPKVIGSTIRATATYADESGKTHTATNTNPSVEQITSILGSKTGYTDLAGGNLVVAFDAGLNHPVVIAVLGSSRNGRFSDVEELHKRTMRALTNE